MAPQTRVVESGGCSTGARVTRRVAFEKRLNGMAKRRVRIQSLADPGGLAPLDGAQKVQVIIETPKGSRNKYAFDPEQKVFALKKVLPAGMAFPYDFGFVPSTKAEDGDPTDVLVLMDEPACPVAS